MSNMIDIKDVYIIDLIEAETISIFLGDWFMIYLRPS